MIGKKKYLMKYM